ncbi:MAG: EamA family transporter [Acetobacteraceae bacterium]|nr:EamA family transporter [Acetobacteraceae bacterium]
MPIGAFLAVLLSALLHASWNALIKQQRDTRGALVAGIVGSAVPAVLVLGVVGLPPVSVLPWLAAAAIVNITTTAMLARAYAAADFAVVYPLTRGLVPLVLALVTPLLFGELLVAHRLAGVGCVSAGIAALGWVSIRRNARLDLVAFAYAVPTALSTATYVLIDAHAARLGHAPVAYAASASAVNGIVMLAYDWARGQDVAANLRRHASVGAIVGTLALISYLLFVWALARAPVALAAALRESSILFAVLIAILVLKERLAPARLAAIAVMVAGIVLIRI